MTDEQTARKIAMEYAPFEHHSSELEAAIVRALQAARKEGMDANDADLVSPREASVESIMQELRTHNEEIGAGERGDEHLRMDAEHIAMVRHDGVSVETFAMMMTDAMLARRAAPPGHIIDDAGVVRKVLGDLPMSIDGMVIGTDARVYWTNGAGYIHDIITQDLLACVNGLRLSPSGLHGSREAAEAAKEAQ